MVVVGEKNYKHIDEGPIRSVRRTRSPTATAEDSSASDTEDGGMRVGGDYQAVIPECNQNAKPDTKMEAMLVWAPHPNHLTDAKIDEYMAEAKEKHGYNMEQALGMLFWHKHSIEKALADLPNFTPFPDEWTVEDKVLFEQAFSFHGKSFHRIRQMLPDKSVGCLVKFYYSWKKTRSRTSLIDRQAHKVVNSQDISDDELDASAPSSDTEAENTKDVKEEGRNGLPGRTGMGARKFDYHARLKNKRKPPRGMFLNREGLISIATGPVGQGDVILKQHQIELVGLKRQVQNNKQLISGNKEMSHMDISAFRIPEVTQKINGRWTNEELLLAVQGVRKYGKDFRAIAEVIGNKTESLVRSFFVNYRRRYNLDEVLAEYAREHSKTNGAENTQSQEGAAADQPVPMEVDSDAVNSAAAATATARSTNATTASTDNTTVISAIAMATTTVVTTETITVSQTTSTRASARS
jgi:REST corepressor 1